MVGEAKKLLHKIFVPKQAKELVRNRHKIYTNLHQLSKEK